MGSPRMVEALVESVMGPDMFEATVDLGFDIRTTRSLKLAGVDAQHLRGLGQGDRQRAMQFLRSRIEGQTVMIRPIRRGEHFYARVYYGRGKADVLEEMVTLGLLRRFEFNGGNGNGNEDGS